MEAKGLIAVMVLLVELIVSVYLALLEPCDLGGSRRLDLRPILVERT
jgi:hypothetical protein